MQAKREYRNRDETEVAVLDALVDRIEEGRTVFELRACVEADIDDLETALAELKDDGLIAVENGEDSMRIYPDQRVVPDNDADSAAAELSLVESLKKKLGF